MVGTTSLNEVSMRIRHFHVQPNIPKELAPLEEIARNLWFSWNWEAVQRFVAMCGRGSRTCQEDRKRAAWFEEVHSADAGARVAYFSCEYGIDEGLPIYSGGPGVPPGGPMKSAFDTA